MSSVNCLFNTFTINKKKRAVYLHRDSLLWDCQKSHLHHTLLLEDVISVDYGTGSEKDKSADLSGCFTLHYAKSYPRNIWKLHTVTFHHDDHNQVKLWVQTLKGCLNNFKHRPKKLLLFVNPFGGKKNGISVFEKYAKPIFNVAGLNVTVVVSQRPNQIRDSILSLDLKIYDAIACVGGDGTFSEVFNGLVMRACRENGINMDDINAELPKPQLPVAIIPAGSTNTLAYCLHGTVDVQTTVLQIIFGNRLGLDLVSAYNEERLLKLYGSVISYGYLGDIILESEKYRWMGPKRYEFTGFKKFMTNLGYKVELEYLTESDDRLDTKCYGDCDICQSNKRKSYSDDTKNWKIMKGHFFMVSGANISCACTRSPNGLSPFNHLGDGTMELILVRHTNMINNLRLLLRLSSKTKSVRDLPFVEVYRTKEFSFRAGLNDHKQDESPVSRSSSWNCDGEVIYDTNLRVKVRCQLINVLTRGCRYQSQITTCC